MKVTIHYNGTFEGLVYSSGYVHDPNCIYVNGTGRNHYEFFIRLNQCGTLGRQEMYHPKRPGEVRVSHHFPSIALPSFLLTPPSAVKLKFFVQRRDQVMWNTLSIQYNPMIEEEWDEHYRVTCEYGSDFWKTVTFPAVNVEWVIILSSCSSSPLSLFYYSIKTCKKYHSHITLWKLLEEISPQPFIARNYNFTPCPSPSQLSLPFWPRDLPLLI